ncbi:Rrf2 family transcriptional regulator [Natrinema sp. CBA1119]|uniref:Rrf2 family transcriptional regulator n=1 Tax=Natrinema sp. CBA1119 TaxID=1608465 RepID=UPI00159BA701|nr:Rrf2 family transcriptional regulator [Natrinema sp. CBA1119]
MNAQFVIASHTLVHLDLTENTRLSSEEIATSVDTNAAFIRQIIGKLRDEGLVTAKRGPNGGFSLSKESADISLLDVHQALDADRIIQIPEYDPHPQCPIGNNHRSVMYDALSSVEKALAEELADVTIKQLSLEIRSREMNRALNSVASSEDTNE